MSEKWLYVDELGEYLEVSKGTVYTWVASKGMPGHKMGRLWKFKAAEVDDWVKSGGVAENT